MAKYAKYAYLGAFFGAPNMVNWGGRFLHCNYNAKLQTDLGVYNAEIFLYYF